MTLRLLLPPSVGPARALARAELLDQSLHADLAETVAVEVASDYAQLSARAHAGEADLVWMPPTICARLEPRMRALFKCKRHGRTTYRSAIVARRGAAKGPGELRGARFAWVDRLSVGGYLLARMELRRAGLDPEHDLGEERFLGSYPEALRAVLTSEVDAAAITVRDDSADAVKDALATFAGRRATQALDTVCVSGPSPNDAIAVTSGLDDRRAAKLIRRVFEQGGGRAWAALCLALDAEGFVRAAPGEYADLRHVLG